MPDTNKAEQAMMEAGARLVKQLDNTTLTVKLIPQVTCFSYANNEAPVPCVIRMVVVCQLSKPVTAGLHITLEENVYSANSNKYLANTWETALGVYVAPGASVAEFRTNIDCPDNKSLPAVYRIGSISSHFPVN